MPESELQSSGLSWKHIKTKLQCMLLCSGVRIKEPGMCLGTTVQYSEWMWSTGEIILLGEKD